MTSSFLLMNVSLSPTALYSKIRRAILGASRRRGWTFSDAQFEADAIRARTYNRAMTLDLGTCSRARLARDARFDGKFYIGVLTTKIYCRPICRSRTSREKNVRYFSSAAAAAQPGFRPCL